MIKNKKDLEMNIKNSYKNVNAAYKDIKAATNMLDTALNIRNAALAVHTAALDNYYRGGKDDSDAYIIARDYYNDFVALSTDEKD